MKGYEFGQAIGRFGLVRAICLWLAEMAGKLVRPGYLVVTVGVLAFGLLFNGELPDIHWPQLMSWGGYHSAPQVGGTTPGCIIEGRANGVGFDFLLVDASQVELVFGHNMIGRVSGHNKSRLLDGRTQPIKGWGRAGRLLVDVTLGKNDELPLDSGIAFFVEADLPHPVLGVPPPGVRYFGSNCSVPVAAFFEPTAHGPKLVPGSVSKPSDSRPGIREAMESLQAEYMRDAPGK